MTCGTPCSTSKVSASAAIVDTLSRDEDATGSNYSRSSGAETASLEVSKPVYANEFVRSVHLTRPARTFFCLLSLSLSCMLCGSALQFSPCLPSSEVYSWLLSFIAGSHYGDGRGTGRGMTVIAECHIYEQFRPSCTRSDRHKGTGHPSHSYVVCLPLY